MLMWVVASEWLTRLKLTLRRQSKDHLFGRVVKRLERRLSSRLCVRYVEMKVEKGKEDVCGCTRVLCSVEPEKPARRTDLRTYIIWVDQPITYPF